MESHFRDRDVDVCYNCFQIRQIQLCAKCRMAKYCSKGCQSKHWKQHKAECKLLGSWIAKLSPESDRRQRVVKAWFREHAWILTNILQDALLPHPSSSPVTEPLLTTHIMVIQVAEEPKGSRSGKLAIQKAYLTPLADLRNAFGTSEDHALSMQADDKMATDWETRMGCKFHLLYLLIRCEDPDEAHFVNEIVPHPISQHTVDRSRYTYLNESWQERLREHFHLSDDTPFTRPDDEENNPAKTRSQSQRDVGFVGSRCDGLFLLIAFLFFAFFW